MIFLRSQKKVSSSRSCLSTNTHTHTDSSSPQRWKFVVPVMNAFSFCLLECKQNLAPMQSWHFILVSLWKSSQSNSLAQALLKETEVLQYEVMPWFWHILFTQWFPFVFGHKVWSAVTCFCWPRSFTLWSYVLMLVHLVHITVSFCLWSQSLDCCHLFLLVHRHSFHLCHCSQFGFTFNHSITMLCASSLPRTHTGSMF